MDATEARALLTGYLNKRMRVVISDGRVIDGNFLCTDKDSNIVLGNCEEFFSQEEVGMLCEVCVFRVEQRLVHKQWRSQAQAWAMSDCARAIR